jgi:hypothetical protein
MTCLLFAAAGSSHAQPQPPGSTVRIKNKTDLDLIVRSYTIVNGSKQTGSLFPLPKAGMGFDLKVPPGVRYYTILDANTRKQIFAQDPGVPVQGRDLAVAIVQLAPNRYAIVPD